MEIQSKGLKDNIILILIGFGITFLAQMSSDINQIKSKLFRALDHVERLEARIEDLESKKS